MIRINDPGRLAILVGFLFLAASACQSINPIAAPETSPPTPDLFTGQYTVSGTNPDGSTYTGRLTIQKTDFGYQLTWSIGDLLYTGTGTVVGDLLTATWRGVDGEGQLVYTRDDQGVLSGTWTVAGQEKPGQETLTPER
jgi:hypothetical protein